MKRTALVTGSNRGIGRAIAEALAQRDDIIVLAAARDEVVAKQTAEAIGRGTQGVALDLTDPVTVLEQSRQIEEENGPVDILINNAGILMPGTALETSISDVSSSIAINALAPLAIIQAIGPGMKSRGWGRIVNVSSGWGSFSEGLSGPAAYSVSKATLNAVTLSSAQALGRSVKVNAACPGWVRTRMGGQAASRSPREGADTAIWLATLADNGPTGGFWRDRRLIDW
ncbi:MAG: SDR family NAD(P)-dependent oxidoreductase [Pseudomonadota bacterium]